jgi:hypothetical protein
MAEEATLTLTIWPKGDGFACPSMDAECLIAIAYLQLQDTLPSDPFFQTAWDASKSVDGKFPSLLCACGWRLPSNVLLMWNHFFDCSVMQTYGIDAWMGEDERADTFAYVVDDTAAMFRLIEFYRLGSELIDGCTRIVDLYLYVTYANWIGTTRHAFTNFLPLYTNYTIPPQQRKAAIARTDSLGTEFLQTDIEQEPETNGSASARPGGANSVSTPGVSLFNFRQQQLSFAQKQMRLEAITTNAIASLKVAEKKLLKTDGKWILKPDTPSILDAIVIGYLALILTTDVSDKWAKELIEEKVPKLAEWAKERIPSLFDELQVYEASPRS